MFVTGLLKSKLIKPTRWEVQQISKGVNKAALFYIKQTRDRAHCFILRVSPNVCTG